MTNPPLFNNETAAEQEQLQNWSRNLVYGTKQIFYPKSVAEIQQLVKEHDKIKALGTRHCFNTIADSQHNLLSLTALNAVVSLNEAEKTVTVEAGIKYGELAPYLNDTGFALHNLASLPHISVAGSCATATHGSGVGNGNLATAVTEVEMVTADGEITQLTKEKDGEIFCAAVVNLGALGVVTKLTLAVEAAYKMQQQVFTDLPLSELKNSFEKIVSAGYSVSLFTDWQSDSINEVWIKSRVGSNNITDSKEFFGAKPATENLHPIADVPAENCTEQMGIAGWWHDRLPHFKMGFMPSTGVELQSEYFIQPIHAVEAIMALQRLGKQLGPYLFISEIRTVAADNLWMSPCYKQNSVALHFTWKQNPEVVNELLPLIERELAPFAAKPHWGKLFTLSPAVLQTRFEKLADFKELAKSYDPAGKFRNDFLNKYIFES